MIDFPRLRHRCALNPSKSEVCHLPSDTLVSFLPMELIGFGSPTGPGESRELFEVYASFTYFADGDVLVAKITPSFENGKGAIGHGLLEGVGFGTTEIHVMRPTGVDSRYLNWLVRSRPFRHGGTVMMKGAAGQQRVPEDFFSDYRVPVDDEPTQLRIVAFLERETERIDALVDKKRRLIDLLEEKRIAIITHAVTKGLDPNAPMKNSGIPWLGEIPRHWRLAQLKHVVALKSGEAITGESISPQGEYPVFGGNGLRGYTSVFTHSGSYVLIGRQGALAGNINYANGEFFASEHAVVADPKFEVPTIWLGEVLMTMDLNQHSKSAAQPGIAVDVIKDLFMPLPPSAEREAVAAYLDRDSRVIEAASEKGTTQLTLLAEYREALITAAVTGEIDVDTFDGDRHREEATT